MLRWEAQSVHTRVHFQKNPVRHIGLVCGQHVDLCIAVHGVPQVKTGTQFQITQLERTLQQQDGAAPAKVAHALGFTQVQQRKAIGGAQSLKHALDSVAAQHYSNYEHVLIDGASKDGTLSLLESRRGQIATLISQPDKGIYDALNKGIRNATGDVVGFLHADDVYADTRVLQRLAAAFADPSVTAVYGDLQYVRKQDINSVIRQWRAGPPQTASPPAPRWRESLTPSSRAGEPTEVAADHWFLNTAGRLFKKASMPSFWSASANCEW